MMERTEHVARMSEIRILHKVLIKKTGCKRSRYR